MLLCVQKDYLMNESLNKKVLLLNQSYQPLMTVNAKRAIILSFTDKVEVLEKYVDKVHSVNIINSNSISFKIERLCTI